LFHNANEARLQVAAAFLPGRICDSHVSLLAKRLLQAIGHITAVTGAVSQPAAYLTEKMGEP
jgi:hypothetical protein